MPLLHSMLDFPAAARDIDRENLIWKAVAYDPENLTKESFLKELNKQLSAVLNQRNQTYHVLTSVSLNSALDLGTSKFESSKIQFTGAAYPRKFLKPRADAIKDRNVPASEGPQNYIKVIATVTAKSPPLALAAALRAVDLHRALWCLFCNPQMEMIGRSWIPINTVRLGALHSVHLSNGAAASQEIWFEPHHIPTTPHSPTNTAGVRKQVQALLKRLALCPYGNDLIEALVLYVRAFDEWNQSTAFTRLWGAVERMASPGYGNYEAVVKRCAFLWDDPMFAAQSLEHLRECRNSYVHTGTESTEAKTHCYQLQMHFRALFFFHIGNIGRYRSLEEANNFLDWPADPVTLIALQKTIARARRFRSSTPRKPA